MVTIVHDAAEEFAGVRIVFDNRGHFISIDVFDSVMAHALRQFPTSPYIWDISRTDTCSWWISWLLTSIRISYSKLQPDDYLVLRAALSEFMGARYEFIAAILESNEVKRGKK